MAEQLKRGEVWLANLNPTQGSEQAGTRPVIIFQNDIVSHIFHNNHRNSFNHKSTPCLIAN
jgi:hypothetical protein